MHCRLILILLKLFQIFTILKKLSQKCPQGANKGTLLKTTGRSKMVFYRINRGPVSNNAKKTPTCTHNGRRRRAKVEFD